MALGLQVAWRRRRRFGPLLASRRGLVFRNSRHSVEAFLFLLSLIKMQTGEKKSFFLSGKVKAFLQHLNFKGRGKRIFLVLGPLPTHHSYTSSTVLCLSLGCELLGPGLPLVHKPGVEVNGRINSLAERNGHRFCVGAALGACGMQKALHRGSAVHQLACRC